MSRVSGYKIAEIVRQKYLKLTTNVNEIERLRPLQTATHNTLTKTSFG